MGCNPFRIDHGFIGGNIQVQVLLVDTPEGTQVRAKRCPRAFAGVTVDLADAIMIIIAGPLPHAVTYRDMGGIAAVITLPFIRVQDRALLRDTVSDQVSACAPVRVITYPEALLTRVTRDDADDGRTIIRISPVPLALIRAPAGRIRGVAMGGTFFPPHSDTVHPPQRRCRSSPRSGR
jgi:hypothetical protein